MDEEIAELLVGYDHAVITPPIGTEMSGYGFFLNRRSESNERHLYANALVLEQNDNRVAIITVDLLAVNAQITARTRALISAETGIPEDNILIACSHTHSGPATIFLHGCGEVDRAYTDLLPRYLASAVIEATQWMEPVRVFAGQTHLNGLAMNRVDPLAPVDNAVQALELINPETERGCALFSFGCHPVSTINTNAVVQPDFPGIVRDMLEQREKYRGALFLQGSAGDINPTVAHSNPGEMRRAAQMLEGATLIAMAQALEVKNLTPLRSVRRTLELPLAIPSRADLQRVRDDYRALLSEREPDSSEAHHARFMVEASESLLMELTGEPDPWLEMLREAQAQIKLQVGREASPDELAGVMDLPPQAVTELLRLQEMYQKEGHNLPETLSCEIQAIQIGEIILLAHPTELFAEFGLQIKAQSPFPHTLVIGYANDFLGYIPNEAEFARKGYAAETVPYMLHLFPFTPDVGKKFVEGCLQLLHELHEA